jgi:hypothetical protein
MASIDDILTVQKNAVIALNNVQQAIAAQNATNTSDTATSSTFITVGPGRLLSFVVTVAGSATGSIYNSASPTGGTASNRLVTIPNTVGIYECNLIFNAGLVLAPGTGQSVNVSYRVG